MRHRSCSSTYLTSRYATLIGYILRQWPGLLAITALTIAGSGAALLQPWPIKFLADYALGEVAVPSVLRWALEAVTLSPAPTTMVIASAVLSLAIFALGSAINTALSWAWSATGQRMVFDLAADLFNRLQRLSLLFHNRQKVGDSLSRLTEDTWCIYSITDGLFVSPGRHLLVLATMGTVAWRLDPVLTAVCFGVCPVLAGAAVYFGPRLKRRAKRQRKARSHITSFVHQTLGAIPVVQAFGAEERNRMQFARLSSEAVAAARSGVVYERLYELSNGMVTSVAVAAVLFVGGQRVVSGAMTVGSLLVVLAYLRSILGAFEGLLGTYGEVRSAEASMDRVVEVLKSPHALREEPMARPLPATAPRGRIGFEGVTFGYESQRPVLEDVSFDVRPGETVALVGATGAGKSTLVSLIPRFFDPWEGRVTFDGADVRLVQLSSLRAAVAIVSQEPFLLPLTVAENIAYGRPGADRDQVVAAAEAAGADAFVREFPEGYDTVVGERGATLSGGQKQRLAIARALLKDAPVVILDEPTSALDPGTEAIVMDAFERLTADRTTFIIAHRLSTIATADRVVVMDGGRVVELGSHRELMALGGPYRHLQQLQGLTADLEVAR